MRTGPRDFEQNGGFWLISARVKAVLEEISHTDFKFLAVDTEVDPGEEPVSLWLCEVVPVLDAIDEARSEVVIATNSSGGKFYAISGLSRLALDEAVVGPHHAFRLIYNPGIGVLDEFFRTRIKQAGLTGLYFRDASKPL